MSKLTFVMPVYNTRTEWLNRAVHSVLAQTNPDWEMIIVDDGSKKDIAHCCDFFAMQDNRIKVYHQNNKGTSAARNYGKNYAKSKWISFIDADDWIEVNYVEEVLKILDQYNELEIMAIGHDDVWPDRIVNHFWGEREFYKFNPSEKEEIQMALLQEPTGLERYPMFFGAQWKFIYSRKFLKSHNIENPVGLSIGEDAIFNLYATEYATQMVFYNKILYHYFHNNESVTGIGFNRDLERLIKLLIAYKKFIDETGKSDNDMYIQAFIKVTLLQFETMLRKYFFHSDNPDSRKQKQGVMMDILNHEPFLSFLVQEKIRGLSIYKRLLFEFIKKRSYVGICCLYKIRTLLKK